MKAILTVLGAFLVLGTLAQNQGNVWYFGIGAGLDFNANPPAPLSDGQTYTTPPNGWNEGSSAISDSLGNLLFYSNGERIWNALQEVMPNGNGLLGDNSSTQASIIIPQPQSNRYFYCFSMDSWEDDFEDGLTFSIVDMCADGGMGDVIPTAKNIPLMDQTAEKLTATNHANGVDYWILSHSVFDNNYYAFLLTDMGIQDTVVSSLGNVDSQGWGGQMVVSPNGQKIAYAVPNGLEEFGFTEIADFDPSTGIVSNAQTLSLGNLEWGASFSPDNSKLYFSTTNFRDLWQYNMNAGSIDEILASKVFIVENSDYILKAHQLGPDGKIYLARPSYPFISRIESPNELGLACGYVEEAIDMGNATSSFGLPEFLSSYNYNNALIECPISVKESIESMRYGLFPNPMTTEAFLELGPIQGEITLEIYNLQGVLLRTQVAMVPSTEIKIERHNLVSGNYVLRVIGEKEVYELKLVVQ